MVYMLCASSWALVKEINENLQKLVELISALQTSKSTLERARAFAVACGKGEVSITTFTVTIF